MLYSSADWTLSFCSKSSYSSRRLKPFIMFLSCRKICICCLKGFNQRYLHSYWFQSIERIPDLLPCACVCYMLHAVPLSQYVPSSDAPISACVWLATFSSPHQTSSLMFTEKKWCMTENSMHSYLFHYAYCSTYQKKIMKDGIKICICKNGLQPAGGSTTPQSAAGPPGMTFLDLRPVLLSSRSAGLCH